MPWHSELHPEQQLHQFYACNLHPQGLISFRAFIISLSYLLQTVFSPSIDKHIFPLTCSECSPLPIIFHVLHLVSLISLLSSDVSIFKACHGQALLCLSPVILLFKDHCFLRLLYCFQYPAWWILNTFVIAFFHSLPCCGHNAINIYFILLSFRTLLIFLYLLCIKICGKASLLLAIWNSLPSCQLECFLEEASSSLWCCW